MGGFVFKTIGDAFCVAFDTPHSALVGALEAQRAQRAAKWGETGELALDEESIALYRQAGDIWLVVILAWSVGVNAAVLGRFAEAHTHLRECLLVGIDLGNRWGASYPLDAFAFLALAERQPERAARLFGAAEAHRTRSGVVPSIADHPALRAIRAAAPAFTGPARSGARFRVGGASR